MINYDTIISNFDDKVTLYNWLRKVEEALKNASATNFVVNKKGNATLSFSITFADGETLESGDIVLQQGESVDQARIASGVLQLHLTNGTWLTAGNIKPVSNFNIDTNQHLIVNYQDGTSQDLGAIFNGNVNIAGNFTANSIIENMTGYSFTPATFETENVTVENLYANVVKTGNKITFVIACYATKISSNLYLLFGKFTIPMAVANQLFSYKLGTFEVISSSTIYIKSGAADAIGTAVPVWFQKGNNEIFVAINLSSIETNKKYYIRVEQTFLLGNNMAQ